MTTTTAIAISLVASATLLNGTVTLLLGKTIRDLRDLILEVYPTLKAIQAERAVLTGAPQPTYQHSRCSADTGEAGVEKVSSTSIYIGPLKWKLGKRHEVLRETKIYEDRSKKGAETRTSYYKDWTL